MRLQVSGRCENHLEPADNRAHGKEECLSVKSFFDGLEYQYRLAKALFTVDKTMPLSSMEAQ